MPPDEQTMIFMIVGNDGNLIRTPNVRKGNNIYFVVSGIPEGTSAEVVRKQLLRCAILGGDHIDWAQIADAPQGAIIWARKQ